MEGVEASDLEALQSSRPGADGAGGCQQSGFIQFNVSDQQCYTYP